RHGATRLHGIPDARADRAGVALSQPCATPTKRGLAPARAACVSADTSCGGNSDGAELEPTANALPSARRTNPPCAADEYHVHPAWMGASAGSAMMRSNGGTHATTAAIASRAAIHASTVPSACCGDTAIVGASP